MWLPPPVPQCNVISGHQQFVGLIMAFVWSDLNFSAYILNFGFDFFFSNCFLMHTYKYKPIIHIEINFHFPLPNVLKSSKYLFKTIYLA